MLGSRIRQNAGVTRTSPRSGERGYITPRKVAESSPLPSSTAQVTAPQRGSGLVRIRFPRRGDRFAESLDVWDGEQWWPCLESADGLPDDAWPPHPPLQQLAIEERPDSCVALLLGMAGTSHWSASIEAVAFRPVIQFDLACRLRQPAARVGCRYRVVPPFVVRHSTNEALLLSGPRGCRLTWEPPLVANWEGDFIDLSLFDVAAPATARWRFAFAPA